MRAIITYCLILAVSFAAKSQKIYSNTFNSRLEFRQWTVVDNNGDESTWQYLASQDSGKRTYYNYHSTNDADDWLISPEIVPEKSGQYVVVYKFEGSEALAESMRIFYGSSPEIETLSKNCAKSYLGFKGKIHDHFYVNLTEGQPFYLAFKACSDKDLYRIYLQSIEVRRCEETIDLAVEKLLSPVTLDSLKSDEKIKFRIKNYGQNLAVAGSYYVSIAVNGQNVVTEKVNTPITAGSYADITLSGKLDLSIPHRNYEITATVSHYEDLCDDNNSLTTSVRHTGPADVPYNMGFEEIEDVSDIKFVKDGTCSGSWSITPGNWYMQPARTGSYALCYTQETSDSPRNWAFLDGLRMEAGYHIVKFWVSTLDFKHGECLRVCWGDKNEPSAMTNLIAVYDPLTAGLYKQKMGIIYLDKPQVVYIGFNATDQSDRNWLCIDDIEVQAVDQNYIDLHICSLVKPTDLQPQLSSKTLLFKVKNHGVKAASGDLRVYVDNVKYYDQRIDVELNADRQLELSGILDKVSEGEHRLRIELVQPDDADQSDNVIELTFRMLGTPDLLWTFEDGDLPEDFIFRTEDRAKLTQAIADEVGDTGYAVIDRSGLPSYNGTHLLAVGTDCTVESMTDRWIVLPQVHVNSADACFVTNVGALSDSINESYRIRVSESSDAWWNYTTLLTVDGESQIRVNRGVNLGDYLGKDIYVAINVTSTAGYALAFDNMAFYGCSLPGDEANSGINGITSDDNLSIVRDGDIFRINTDENVAIEIFELDGRKVMRTNDHAVDISHLTAGIYCIKVKTPSTSTHIKFSK